VRSGGLGSPRRGIGRLALETGARVVPVAVAGTEDVRRGWRIRPRKVRLRCGAPLGFPLVAAPSSALAATVTERVWARIGLQWEWLRCGSPAPAGSPAVVREHVPSRARRRASRGCVERSVESNVALDARAIAEAGGESAELLVEREARAA
jgi:hypothetical protein